MNCRGLRSSSFSLFSSFLLFSSLSSLSLFAIVRVFFLDCLQFSSLYLVASLLLHHGSVVIAHVLPRSITVFFSPFVTFFCPPGTDGSGEGKYVGDGYLYCSRRFSVIPFLLSGLSFSLYDSVGKGLRL